VIGNKCAFSLLELSIVLVIIGLIAGGIVSGANMIRAAEVRAVITETQRYMTSVNTFRDKYLGVPGDLKNAEAFWGSMTNCGAASPSGTGTQTCNGDGDGIVEPAAAALQTGENFGIWQHLSNAGLIEGVYSGIAGTLNTNHALLGENQPESKLSGAGWALSYWDNSAGTSGITYSFNYGNQLGFAAVNSSTGAPNQPVLTPPEAWSIDKKVDDGRPAYGKVIARNYIPCTTSTTYNDFDKEYELDSDDKACTLIVRNMF